MKRYIRSALLFVCALVCLVFSSCGSNEPETSIGGTTELSTEPSSVASSSSSETTALSTVILTLPATLPPSTSETTSATTEQTTAATTSATTETTTQDIFELEIEPPVYANAAEPLDIATPDGYDQTCHPKVLYFEDGWNGWEFWMAHTPYPYCDDNYENPCIAVSHNGIDWVEPEGISNPVTGYPPTFDEGAHYSDPHLLMNGETMELWFRWNPSYGNGINADSNGGVILRTKSSDGINWSDIETVYPGSEWNFDPVLSPAVVLNEDGSYSMWYSKRDGKIWRTTSSDGFTWSELEETDLEVWGYNIWHQDIIFENGVYEIVFCARPQNSTNNLVGLDAYYAMSYDGINWTDPVKILSPDDSVSGYDNCSIYRLSLVKADGVYMIYYSSMSDWYVWKINLAAGKDISSLVGMGRDGFDAVFE